MIERFQNENHPALVEALLRQAFANGRKDVAEEFISVGELAEFKTATPLISQDDKTTDVFLIVAGTVSVVANGVEVRTLAVGDHVGEMSAVNPSNPRSATVLAEGTVVALRVQAAKFLEICDKFPELMWKPIARELAHRLWDRNRTLRKPNDRAKLFIISSVEALDVAREVASNLEHDALSTVWTDGVFWASGYPLESLERAVAESDFAVAIALFEDVVQSRGTSHQALRDNVLFELGMFMGQLGRRRTFLIHPKLPDLHLPSDLHGITPASFMPGKPEDLAARIGPACNQIRKVMKAVGIRTQEG